MLLKGSAKNDRGSHQSIEGAGGVLWGLTCAEEGRNHNLFICFALKQFVDAPKGFVDAPKGFVDAPNQLFVP